MSKERGGEKEGGKYDDFSRRKGGRTIFLPVFPVGLTGGKSSRRLALGRRIGQEGGAWGADAYMSDICVFFTHMTSQTEVQTQPAL